MLTKTKSIMEVIVESGIGRDKGNDDDDGLAAIRDDRQPAQEDGSLSLPTSPPKRSRLKRKKDKKSKRRYTAEKVTQLKKKQSKQKPGSPPMLTEDFRLKEVLLYLLMCDVTLLLCQYNHDESLKIAFDAIFATAEIPETLFPAVRFRMLSARLEEVAGAKNTKSSSSNSSSRSKQSCKLSKSAIDALLSFGLISPVLTSRSTIEMNAYHAHCHLKRLPKSVMGPLRDLANHGGESDKELRDDYHHDLRHLRSCIAAFEGEHQLKSGSNAGTGINPRRVKFLLFVISTQPAFMKVTQTKGIRLRELQALLSRKDQQLKSN